MNVTGAAVPEADVFEIFYQDRLTDAMQALVAAGRRPVGYQLLMMRQLDALNSSLPGEIDRWLLHYTGSGDGARRLPDGSLKFAWDSPTLLALTASSMLSKGRKQLALPLEVALLGDGPLFGKEVVEKYEYKRHRSPAEALANPLYVDGLARGNRDLAKVYADGIFDFARERGVDVNENGLLLISPPEIQKIPVEGLWCTSPVDRFLGGRVDSNYSLQNAGWLVGATLETLAHAYASLDAHVATLK
jgi:hypothetical protein